MAVQEYIGWPTDVNRIILDSTNISFGENAVRTDELESGLKRTMMRGGFCADKYSVTMTFDWKKKPGEDKSEFDRFTEWYKYKHKYGSVPFEFPKILLASNTGLTVYDTVDRREGIVEYYKITSPVQGKKSGEAVEVTMTWENVYTGIVSVTTPLPAATGIQATTKYVDVFFSSVSDTAPVHDQFSLTIDNVAVTMTGFCYDGSKTVRIYYPEVQHGSVRVTINDYSGYTATLGPSTF